MDKARTAPVGTAMSPANITNTIWWGAAEKPGGFFAIIPVLSVVHDPSHRPAHHRGPCSWVVYQRGRGGGLHTPLGRRPAKECTPAARDPGIRRLQAKIGGRGGAR